MYEIITRRKYDVKKGEGERCLAYYFLKCAYVSCKRILYFWWEINYKIWIVAQTCDSLARKYIFWHENTYV